MWKEDWQEEEETNAYKRSKQFWYNIWSKKKMLCKEALTPKLNIAKTVLRIWGLLYYHKYLNSGWWHLLCPSPLTYNELAMPGPVFGAGVARKQVFALKWTLGQGVVGDKPVNHFRATLVGIVMDMCFGCYGSTEEGHLLYPFSSLGEVTPEL